MNYAAIYEADCANGIGLRTSLFVSGCTRHCPGCFNEKAWDFGYGKPFTLEVEDYVLSTLARPGVAGLSVLGGEPMEPANQEGVLRLVMRAKDMGSTVWLYTGYRFEEIRNLQNTRVRGPYTDALLSFLDVMVDGPFIMEQKDISLRFRGSRNQRILDMPQSLAEGRAVEASSYGTIKTS